MALPWGSPHAHTPKPCTGAQHWLDFAGLKFSVQRYDEYLAYDLPWNSWINNSNIAKYSRTQPWQKIRTGAEEIFPARHVAQLGSVLQALPPNPSPFSTPGTCPFLCSSDLPWWRGPATCAVCEGKRGVGRGGRSRVLAGLSGGICHPVGSQLEHWLGREGLLMPWEQQPPLVLLPQPLA